MGCLVSRLRARTRPFRRLETSDDVVVSSEACHRQDLIILAVTSSRCARRR
jgi:hypothetical protein